MTAVELLSYQWDRCYDGQEDWYPPLADALKDVTAEQAHWRPAGEKVNTIWENVNHLVYYKERFLKRLNGEESSYPPGVTNDDTFAVPSTAPSDWTETLARLRSVHYGIRDHIAAMDEKDFDRLVPTNSVGMWLSGLIMHDAYHTGQIIMLRKLQGSWPSHRSFE
ncbi:hypothetical protein SD71_16690 [Cohnella kolymensis]|uniref:DinB-like domain-containing protein n=1 Tax=Cohnella kolymensis TaxID=1590652 RepID=A0ABR5A0Z8_9BACL|nr:DinB family protein [Cohnella kolymensis]KIL34710.1 hypothetical protein SD71_16690 [Cohnella kolymensis]